VPRATYTGKRCLKHGNAVMRYVSTGRCVACQDGAPVHVFPSPKAPKELKKAEQLRHWERLRRLVARPSRKAPKRCECCGREFKSTLHLYRGHETGVLRGWLCMKCDNGIEFLGGSIAGIELALRFLRRNHAVIQAEEADPLCIERDSLIRENAILARAIERREAKLPHLVGDYRATRHARVDGIASPVVCGVYFRGLGCDST
jgi:hypothetical protein